MVNDLREQLHESVATAPEDRLDLADVVAGGRRRVRRRRVGVVGAAVLATAGMAVVASLVTPGGETGGDSAASMPRPDAPTLRMTDAVDAVEGRDYRVLASHTNENLNRGNGQYFEGVTDDGLILFADGPHADQPIPRLALMDPETGQKDWLPASGRDEHQHLPLELGEDRLVLLGLADRLVVHVFDREVREWTEMQWPELPAVENPFGAVLGPDDRIYVPLEATPGRPSGGGDDSGAEGDTYRLWSASLTDASDVRDEELAVGSVAFADGSMVWTDSTNGASGRVHVRDLDSGEEESFDPHSGDRCNLLTFGAAADRIVMGQYCGTYGETRDDRVQVLDLDGDQVVTLQGDSIDLYLAAADGDGPLTVKSRDPEGEGTFIYDIASGEFLRVAAEVSNWVTSGPARHGQFLFDTPVNRRRGMTQHLAELLG